MLITKEVEVRLVGSSVKRYENLGYIIPRIKNSIGKMTIEKDTKIKVKVEDLSVGSHVLVFVKCDCKDCTTPIIKPIIWQDYLKGVKDDGNYYCKKCSRKLYSMDTLRRTNLKNSKSFEEWCIDHDRQDILDRWDYELNELSPNEVLYGTREPHWFKCPRGLHESELKNIKGFTHGQEGSIRCNKCNSFAQYGLDTFGENFLNEYWDYKNNTVDPWIISKCSRTNIYVFCQEKKYHSPYNLSCASFIGGNRCPYCYGFKIHPLDSLGTLFPQVLSMWSSKNIKSAHEYSPYSMKEVWWKCPDGSHKDYLRNVNCSTVCKFRCPECTNERTESILQGKVRLYLNELGYEVLHEHKCNITPISPKTKGHLPFDNEVVKLKLIIEVNGEQHYKEANGKWFNKDFDLHKRKLYDRYKKFISYTQGYNYLAIPYWTNNTKEDWKTLIDNKIQQLNNNIKLN